MATMITTLKSSLPRYSIRALLFAGITVSIIGFTIFALISSFVISRTKVTGPIYSDIIRNKDLVADILPPPEYIIESWLTAHEARHAAERGDNTAIGLLKEKFATLKKEYDERQAYWDKQPLAPESKKLLLDESHKPAEKFYAIANNEFFPALEKADQTAAQAAFGKLRDAYELHRKKIDELVILANQNAKACENNSAAYLRNATIFLATLACLVGIFVIVINLYTLRGVLAAFKYCQEIATVLSTGDLTVEIEVTGRGGLRSMLISLADMQNHLKTIIKDLQTISAGVASASSQLHSASDQIANGAEELVAQTNNVATASEEMTTTSNDIAQNCHTAAESAEMAANALKNGFDIVKHTIDGIRTRGEKTRASADIVSSLGNRSEQIGDIVGTIEDIADQTNLLALNAAIEAARAGEMGRGFAVVADEVRALAERTTKATKEISEMIGTIQQETRIAMSSMEEGVRGTEQGALEAAELETSLQQILKQVNDVTMQISQIATATEEQTATTDEVSTNIHQITEAAQQTASGAEETAASAAQLDSQAHQLQQLVQKFTI